ncbi:PRN1 [Candida oxycetoniae]|uniref:PRN1 n=1 Tax=Candida oxycetoniae TaxID=497107 RepID=A0AAI9T1R1_9ASCO|nr:PRN1 [Candida oxycetoniae]KAI3407039.1 PRN1 [Candida oxycetoniae]
MKRFLKSSTISKILIIGVFLSTLTVIQATQQHHSSNSNISDNSTNLEMPARSIAKIITARQQAEGVGARVRRSIGIMNQRKFDPFLMFDHFSGTGKNGFPEHPHRGQETITLMLQGAFAHEDFTGSKGILYPGDLQFMTAGRGVVHSEMPVPNEDGSPISGLQLWVDLPNELKDTEPRYRDLREWEVPVITAEGGKVIVRVISGRSYGAESVKDLAYTPVDYYYYTLKAGGEFKQELTPGFNYFLYVLKGNTLVLNDDQKINQYQNVFYEEEGDFAIGRNSATENTDENDVEFVLVGGKKLNQEVVQYGPFVVSRKEDVQKAILDYQFAQNGFENVRTWKTLISNGVTPEMIEGPLQGNLELRAKKRAAYFEQKKQLQAEKAKKAEKVAQLEKVEKEVLKDEL